MRNSWAAEHPIGNPAIDGRLHEPISATFAAIAAGTATAATVMAGIGMIGTALSVVGMVTGNAGLAKIGGAMGLVGGIGGLAANAFSGAGSAVAEGATSAMAEGAASTAGQTIGDNVAASLSTGAQAADGVAGSFGNMLADSGVSSGAGLASEAASGAGLIGSSMDSSLLGAGVEGIAGNAASPLASNIPGIGPTPLESSIDSGALGGGSAAQAGAATGGSDFFGKGEFYGPPADLATKPGGGILSGVSDFFKSNKELINVGGNMIKGAGDQQTAKDLAKMRYEYEKALQDGRLDYAKQLQQQYNASVAASQVNMRGAAPGAAMNTSGTSLGRASGIMPARA